ncbi:hypothetical protein DSECCO2_577490 [anaerobic digester metagenome]
MAAQVRGQGVGVGKGPGPGRVGDHERLGHLALDLVRHADDRRLGHEAVRAQRGLDLGRAQAVPGDIEHVVGAALDPVVAVLVAPGHVAGEIHARDLLPVRLAVAGLVPGQAREHPGPGLAQHQEAALVGRHGRARGVHHIGGDAGQGLAHGAGLEHGDGHGRKHGHAGFRLPPGVEDRAVGAADVLVKPHPGLGGERLAHAAQKTQGGEVAFFGILRAVAHEHAHERRRGVEDRGPVAFDDRGQAVGLGVEGVAFVEDDRRAG